MFNFSEKWKRKAPTNSAHYFKKWARASPIHFFVANARSFFFLFFEQLTFLEN